MSSGAEDPGTLWELVRRAAQSRPEAVAVRHGDQAVTFAGLRERVLAAARQLPAHTAAPDLAGAAADPGIGAGAGIGTGTATAGLLFENTLECAVAFLAAARAGLRLVPLEPDVGAPQLLALRGQLGPLTLIGHEAKLRALRTGDAGARGHWQGGGLVSVEELLARPAPGAAPDGPPLPPEPEPDAPFLYPYTSGSTGEPKAAVHSQRNLVHGGEIYAHTYGITPADRVLAAVPLLHSFGMVAGLVTALFSRAQLVLLGRFVPARLLRALHDHACTVLVGTPLAYDLLARSAAAPTAGQPALPEALRLCLSSGAPLPAAVADRFREHCGRDVCEVYGSTEAGVIAAQTPRDHGHEGDGGGPEPGVGRPVRGVRVRLLDEAGRPVPLGATGSLQVRTPAMFSHYLDRPGATAQAFRDGWYVTGDLARTDAEGRLHLVGRKDSFINVGGKKVNPTEVERVLLAHPAVAEAVVWGEAVGGTSERVRAAVVPRDGLGPAELTAHCRDRLLPHQVPGRIEFVASLPRSALGKVRRAAVARESGP
ncbi:fatty acid--CoA ligase family protein [Streptomyces sp. NPDC002054]|uniref:class I adenylate-forming enzyme family protein n=1 Tax=Streptomyces sp. NPDC002054 TaxID=3154663 RepID=UPI003321A781